MAATMSDSVENSQHKLELEKQALPVRFRFDRAIDYHEQARPPDKTAADQGILLGSESKAWERSCFARASDYHEPHLIRSGATAVEVQEWRPSRTVLWEIQQRVEKEWAGEGNRPIEGKGVEAACRYLRDYEGTKAIVVSRNQGGADIIALDRQDRVIVAEVKATNDRLTLRGTVASDGVTRTGDLARPKLNAFELSPGWLRRYRTKMEADIGRTIEQLPADEQAPYRELRVRVHSLRFGDQDAYRRMVFSVGPRLELGDLEAYDKTVKPERYVKIYV